MATKKVKGAGTVLQATIGGVLTTITQRVTIDGPSVAVGSKDVTDLDSLANEKRPTIPDNGDVSMQVWLDPNDPTHQQLATWAQTPVDPLPMKILFSSTPAKSVQFNAFVSAFKPGGMSYDGYLTADITLSISGVITWA